MRMSRHSLSGPRHGWENLRYRPWLPVLILSSPDLPHQLAPGTATIGGGKLLARVPRPCRHVRLLTILQAS